MFWTSPFYGDKYSFVDESKQIAPDNTAPIGAVWSGIILFALEFPVLIK